MHSRYQHQLLWSTWCCPLQGIESCIKTGLAELTTVEQTTILFARQQCSHKQVCILWGSSVLDCTSCIKLQQCFHCFKHSTHNFENIWTYSSSNFSCISSTDSKWHPFKQTFKLGNWKTLLERDQDCRMAVEPLEFCLLQETSAWTSPCAWQYSHRDEISCFCQGSSHVFAVASCRCSKTVTDNSWVTFWPLKIYSQCTIPQQLNRIMSTVFKLDLPFLHFFSLSGTILTSITKIVALYWYHTSRPMPHLT